MAEYIAREVLLAQLREMESYDASPMYWRGYDDCVETILKRLPPMLCRWYMGGGFGTKKNLSTSVPRRPSADLIITLRLRISNMVFIMRIGVRIAARRWTEA